jgi:hypothetical protein
MTFRLVVANAKETLFLSALLLFFLLLYPYDLFSQNSNFSGQSPNKIENLTIPYEDVGACPFECCAYRDWVTRKETAVRVDRKRNSPVAFRVRKGEKVAGVTGVVITTRPGRARISRATDLLGVEAHPGDLVFLLSYKGEGVYKAWFRGRVIKEFSEFDAKGSFAEIIEKPKFEWWVQIRNTQSLTGWTDQTDNFDSKDGCGG